MCLNFKCLSLFSNRPGISVVIFFEGEIPEQKRHQTQFLCPEPKEVVETRWAWRQKLKSRKIVLLLNTVYKNR